jgi:copper chaperone CopZ
METLNLAVPALHCTSCKLTIEEALEQLNGVADSDVDLDTKQVTMSYHPDTVGNAAITAAIEQAGYAVQD